MAQRTGSQLKGTDMGAIEAAVDAVIATPNEANAQALVSACASVLQHCRDSAPTITESATLGTSSHSTAGRKPAHEIGQLVDGVRKDALTILGTRSETDPKQWQRLKRTHFGSASQWTRYKVRPTTD